MLVTLKTKMLDNSQRLIIALDGPAASGKGTIGQMLAQLFHLAYFQSSLVYRGLAVMCDNQHIDLADTAKVIALSKLPAQAACAGQLGRDEHIASIASKVASVPEVRQNLGVYLKQLIATTHRIIMEGRDIGTVIAPAADLKIFITADVNVRAERRYKQLQGQGKKYMLWEVLDQLAARDRQDQTRRTAPLIPAKDALVIDTTNLEPLQVVSEIKKLIS